MVYPSKKPASTGSTITPINYFCPFPYFSHTVVNVIIVILFAMSKNWKDLLALQIIVCIVHPILEFLLSPLVRFKVGDFIEMMKGENIPSNEVIVT